MANYLANNPQWFQGASDLARAIANVPVNMRQYDLEQKRQMLAEQQLGVSQQAQRREDIRTGIGGSQSDQAVADLYLNKEQTGMQEGQARTRLIGAQTTTEAARPDQIAAETSLLGAQTGHVEAQTGLTGATQAETEARTGQIASQTGIAQDANTRARMQAIYDQTAQPTSPDEALVAARGKNHMDLANQLTQAEIALKTGQLNAAQHASTPLGAYMTGLQHWAGVRLPDPSGIPGATVPMAPEEINALAIEHEGQAALAAFPQGAGAPHIAKELVDPVHKQWAARAHARMAAASQPQAAEQNPLLQAILSQYGTGPKK